MYKNPTLIKSGIEISTSCLAEATKGLKIEMSKKRIDLAYVKEKSNAIAEHTQSLAYWKNKQGEL
jgi:hypothetical protein